ncbi:hypothetical protein EPUS_02315 [Endocarpon pusillum Z07020]|uniref:Uncharacterized protein n=1 Tax=Endocarpon pusillum (strain Z07020 / HMAS-L-300199) TaxID=1263415 RepID=U1GXD0_ENDPU|nr:uncharacterized protein EPUS_02315 [Endocarpon pusillum Z07020]ERF76776.1 hypothetical protein EPUS_02315 [Endocarpon pusillum Z07020]
MAGQTEEKDSGSSSVKRVIRPVIPALPLRPVKRQPASKKHQDVDPVEDEPQRGTSMPLLSGGCSTPDRALKIQFGETKGDCEQAVHYSSASFAHTSSSLDVTPSSVPSGMFELGQLEVSNAEKSLPDGSNNNDTLTQGISSRTSSAPPTLTTSSDSPPPTQKQTLHTPVVQLPAQASISRSSSLQISFLYQEETDSASTESTPDSESKTPPLNSQPLSPPAIDLLDVEQNQALTGTESTKTVPDPLTAFELFDPANPIMPSYPARAHILPSMMIPLYMYLLSLFDYKLACDQQIDVHVPGPSPFQFSFDAHKVIICRSPLLAMLVHSNAINGLQNSSINLFWPVNYFNEAAFIQAFRHLYSNAILNSKDIEEMTFEARTRPAPDWRASQLMFTISYWLGGLILQADPVVEQAKSLVLNLLNFDIIGTALTAATLLRDHDYTRDEHNNAIANHQSLYTVAETVGVRLQNMIFAFIAENIIFKDFQLDTNPHQTLVRPLFPVRQGLIDHYRRQVPVQTLQFGQLPPQQVAGPAQQFSMDDSHTSYIMLNVPFSVLKEAVPVMREVAEDCLVDDALVKDFFKKVVAEREVRRWVANTDRTVTDAEQFANMDVWGVIGYEETVEDGENGEWYLSAECSDGWAARGG